MPSQAVAGYGAKIRIGDGGAPETFTDIPEVMDIEGPGIELETADVTSHGSAVDGFAREFIPTLMTVKECTFDINYLSGNATHIALRTVASNRTRRNFRRINSTATQTISFAGFITEMTFKDPVDDAVKASITITPTGVLTFS